MNESTSESTPVTQLDGEEKSGATFDLPDDDPRRTDNRGGLKHIVFDAPDPGVPDGGNRGDTMMGTTAAADGEDAVGATGTSQANSGQLDVSTRGLAEPDAAPAGAGPVEGSLSGAVAPHIEMTDIGLVDVNAADMSLPDDPAEGMGARVEDAEGNLL